MSPFDILGETTGAARRCRVVLAFLLFFPGAGLYAVHEGQFDPLPVWPLCGRISEDPSPEWVDSDGCPPERWGNLDSTDVPISSTFGPRQLVSEGFRYDFHRGMDIGCPIGTPVFAMAPGIVRKAGPDPSYSDPFPTCSWISNRWTRPPRSNL